MSQLHRRVTSGVDPSGEEEEALEEVAQAEKEEEEEEAACQEEEVESCGSDLVASDA